MSIEQIKHRNDALDPQTFRTWQNAILFAIDAPLLNDPKFAPMLAVIRQAPLDVRTLLARVTELETSLRAALDILDDQDEFIPYHLMSDDEENALIAKLEQVRKPLEQEPRSCN